MNIIDKLLAGFDVTTKGGFSARKMSAFVVLICVIIAHVKWFKSDRWEYLGEVLTLDFGFVCVCLGLTTYENIKTKSTKDEKAE
jgi:hypothetical protein